MWCLQQVLNISWFKSDRLVFSCRLGISRLIIVKITSSQLFQKIYSNPVAWNKYPWNARYKCIRALNWIKGIFHRLAFRINVGPPDMNAPFRPFESGNKLLTSIVLNESVQELNTAELYGMESIQMCGMHALTLICKLWTHRWLTNSINGGVNW